MSNGSSCRNEAGITRSCGDCQLCCTLVPVRELGKGANARCGYQRFAKGCTIYDRRPMPCRLWSCRWLTDSTTIAMRRPDRAGYVIDMMPDYIDITDNDTGETRKVEVVQIWIDPKRPTAYQSDKALLAWLTDQSTRGTLALLRSGSTHAEVLMPHEGRWCIVAGQSSGRDHTADEIIQFMAGVE